MVSLTLSGGSGSCITSAKESLKTTRKPPDGIGLAAEQGYANAQWSLGSLYRFGMGVPKDFVAAHAWFNLAAAQGHGDAAPDRNDLAAQMTAPQITSAQDLARDLWSQVSQMTIP